MVITGQVSDDKLLEVVSAINIFDIKGDGSLPLTSVTDCLRSLGLNPLSSDVKKIVDDLSNNGRNVAIDIDQFMPIYQYFLRKRRPTFNELCEGLKTLHDEACSEGGMPAHDLGVALTCFGDRLTTTECDAILSHVTNKNGLVSIAKLVELVMGDDDRGAGGKRNSLQGQGGFKSLNKIKENLMG